jgi:hypothetical protein
VISPEHVLAALRTVLRDEVLPHVADPRARTSLVATLGILGDLALQVTEDDRWCADSVRVLDIALRRCGAAGTAADGHPGETPAQHRHRLLAVARRLLSEPDGGTPPGGLGDLRSALAHDLTLQQRRTRTTGGP